MRKHKFRIHMTCPYCQTEISHIIEVPGSMDMRCPRDRCGAIVLFPHCIVDLIGKEEIKLTWTSRRKSCGTALRLQ